MKEKKFALVTGCAKRIGAELCKVLANNNYNLIIHYNNSENEAIELKNFILQNDPSLEIYLFQCDLTDLEKTQELIEFIKEKCGHLNALINNASIFTPENFSENSPEFIIQNTNIHFTTPLILSQYLLDSEKNNCEGKILINMLDVHRLQNIQHNEIHPYGRYFTHCATKHSLYLINEYLTKEIQKEKLDTKIFGLALGAVLENKDDIKYFEKLKVTQNDMLNKMDRMRSTFDNILKQRDQLENQIFKIE
jgi:pteridine reductase